MTQKNIYYDDSKEPDTMTKRTWKWERFVQCKICNETVDMFTYTHMKKHDMTQLEYCLKFPEHARPQFWACEPGLEADKKFEKIREEAERLNNEKESE